MSLFENPFDPAHETALVSGAGNGIGKAIAQALVGEGVRTVFADISEERVADAIKTSPRRFFSFSPCGRRWREAPDEGSLSAGTKRSLRRHTPRSDRI